ncbi:MAG: LysR family transcriptional regulator [Pseudomonadota bacterium]
MPFDMKYWSEIRTALILARLGTVSAAAKEIGVHRATVNRHVETLEAAFNARLFLRHARGFTLTEEGREVFEVAARADEMFADLQKRSRGKAGMVSGTLMVTAMSSIAPTIMPSIRGFQTTHPEIDVEFIVDAKLAKLEYGEAHIAFRTGPQPKQPDYVVLPHKPVRFGLYAAQDYIDRVGLPEVGALEGHKFVSPYADATHLPYLKWITENVPEDAIALRANNSHVRRLAICHGIGVGFIDDQDASLLRDLVEIMPPSEDIQIDLWVVTHSDLHRTAKVQAFLDHVR